GCPTLGGEPFKLWKDVPYIVSPSEAVIHLAIPDEEEAKKIKFEHKDRNYLFEMDGVKGCFTCTSIDEEFNMKIGYILSRITKLKDEIEKLNSELKTKQAELEKKQKDLEKKELESLSNQSTTTQPNQPNDKKQKLEDEIKSKKDEINSIEKVIKDIEDKIKSKKNESNLSQTEKATRKNLDSVPFSLYLLKSGGKPDNESDRLLLLEVKK
ncbi:MAG: hypothetical protein ACRC2T_18440, partial [Thermoguttaceae bacterium]